MPIQVALLIPGPPLPSVVARLLPIWLPPLHELAVLLQIFFYALPLELHALPPFAISPAPTSSTTAQSSRAVPFLFVLLLPPRVFGFSRLLLVLAVFAIFLLPLLPS